jgi:phospholipid-transporting ATPase
MATDDGVADHRTVFCNDPDPLRDRQFKFTNNSVSTTKYNFFTFFPKGLFEQFRRVANLYFLMIAILSTTPVSPVQPITNIVPLVLVLGVSLIKEAFEDNKRWRNDKVVNSSLVDRLEGRIWLRVPWSAVKVGDLVRVSQDHYFPADMLLLASTNADGICYIEVKSCKDFIFIGVLVDFLS